MEEFPDREDRVRGLVSRVRSGDTEAFRELFACVEPSAYAQALGMVGNPEDAREVVQEAAMESFRRIDCLRDPAKFPAWVAGMVRFLSLRRRRRPRLLSLEGVPPEALAVRAAPSAEEADAEDPGVAKALGALGARYREVLILRHVDGKGYGEIARDLGISSAGVDSRLSRARAMLRKALVRERSREGHPSGRVGS